MTPLGGFLYEKDLKTLLIQGEPYPLRNLKILRLDYPDRPVRPSSQGHRRPLDRSAEPLPLSLSFLPPLLRHRAASCQRLSSTDRTPHDLTRPARS